MSSAGCGLRLLVLLFLLKLAQAAQRGGGCPIPGNTQGQVRGGSGQPDPGEDVPAHCRGLGWMAFRGPFQPKPFCDSMKSLQQERSVFLSRAAVWVFTVCCGVSSGGVSLLGPAKAVL